MFSSLSKGGRFFGYIGSGGEKTMRKGPEYSAVSILFRFKRFCVRLSNNGGGVRRR